MDWICGRISLPSELFLLISERLIISGLSRDRISSVSYWFYSLCHELSLFLARFFRSLYKGMRLARKLKRAKRRAIVTAPKTPREIRKNREQLGREREDHEENEWLIVLLFFGARCIRCWRSNSVAPVGKDHVVPLYKGGSNSIFNIQPLCRPCNVAKGKASTDYRPAALRRLIDNQGQF